MGLNLTDFFGLLVPLSGWRGVKLDLDGLMS